MSVLTYPYTPGLTFGETTRFDVEVHRFDDLSEQRYLRSVQRGLDLTYEYPTPSSALVAGIESWFVGHVGPGLFFNVTDHRTGETHLARFADNVLEHVRRAPMQRSLTVRFHVVESGHTAVVLQPFTRAAPPDCTIISSCFPVSTPAITGVDPDVFLPSSGTFVASGDSAPLPEGADYAFFRTVSGAAMAGAGNLHLPSHVGGDISESAVPTVLNNRMYALPFLCTRSGATIGELGAWVRIAAPAGALMRMGLYVANSSTGGNLEPGSMLADFGTVSIATAGLATVAASHQLQPENFYYLTFATSKASLTLWGLSGTAQAEPLGYYEDGGSLATFFYWAASHVAAGPFPSSFPTPIEKGTGAPAAVGASFIR